MTFAEFKYIYYIYIYLRIDNKTDPGDSYKKYTGDVNLKMKKLYINVSKEIV